MLAAGAAPSNIGNIMNKQFFALLLSMAVSSCALAQVSVSQPWVRASVPAAKATGAFMLLKSTRDARLIEVRTSVADAEIHEMVMDGQMMKMHQIAGLDLPAGQEVKLASGGYHIMLMNLKRQMKEGETVPMTLVIQYPDKKTESIAVAVPIKALTHSAAAH
jgi:copper(I)-binding protein